MGGYRREYRYYADYEALEFTNDEAERLKCYPWYLDKAKSKRALCPLYFAASTPRGKICYSRSYKRGPVSFIKFLDFLIKDKKPEDAMFTVFFHNLSYDFAIIVNELLASSAWLRLDEDEGEEEPETVKAYRVKHDIPPFIQLLSVSETLTIENYTEPDKWENNTWTILGESLARYSGINMTYKGFQISLRDTFQIMPVGQDKILKDFGLETKVEVNWDGINANNVGAQMPLISERCRYDVTSLATVFTSLFSTLAKEFNATGTTASGLSINAFKHYLWVKAGSPKGKNPDGTKITPNDIFRDWFPVLTDEENALSALTFVGGVATLDSNKAGKVWKKVGMLDENAEYPNAMTGELPYGTPVPLTGFCEEGYSEYIVDITFEHKHTPFIRCHSENAARNMIGLATIENTHSKIDLPQGFNGIMGINSIDLATVIALCDVTKLEFKKGYNYQTTTIAKEFVEHLYTLRKASKEPAKNKAIKIILNSLYGKFAQDLTGIQELYKSLTLGDNEKFYAIDREKVYKPLASAVTAIAREELMGGIVLCGDDFIYTDTDSLFFTNPEKVIQRFKDAGLYDKDRLGAWAEEKEYTPHIKKAKFLGKKIYILDVSKKGEPQKNVVKCVGLANTYHNQVNFNNFKIGNEPFLINKMVNVHGGKAMRKTEFVIRERSY